MLMNIITTVVISTVAKRVLELAEEHVPPLVDKTIEKAGKAVPIIADKTLDIVGHTAVVATPVIGNTHAIAGAVAIENLRGKISRSFTKEAQKPSNSHDEFNAIMTQDVDLPVTSEMPATVKNTQKRSVRHRMVRHAARRKALLDN